jgi:DNA invertase Pin-like site-specific DNA recombinase
MLLGYARVSKGETQDTRMQETALRAAGVERLFTEQASGGRWDRPHLHRLLDQLRPEDVVIVCTGCEFCKLIEPLVVVGGN